MSSLVRLWFSRAKLASVRDSLAKPFNYLDPREVFLQDHTDPRQVCLCLAAVFPDLLSEVEERINGYGHDQQAPESQVRVEENGSADQADEHDYLAHEHDHVGQAGADRGHVGSDAAHEHAHLALGKIGHGQADDLGEHVPAQVSQHLQAGSVHDEDLAYLREALGDDENDETEDAQFEHREVFIYQDLVGDVFG